MKNNFTKEIAKLNRENNKLIKEEKRLKIKLKEEENEILNLKSKLKSEISNVTFEKLIICKEISLLHLGNKKNIDIKNNNKYSAYKNISEELNNRENKKSKEKSADFYTKNNLIYSTYSNKNKNSKSNILSNKPNNSNNKNNKNYKNQNKNYYISNIIDFIHEQNEYYSPSNFNKIDSTSFKQENPEKSKSKKSSPSSQNKLFSTINNNNYNRNNSQVMINVNTNIINSNGSVEKFKLYKKIKDYHKIFERKINEITRNVIPKSIKRTLSAFQNRRHSSPNFYDGNRQGQYSSINKQINKNTNKKMKKSTTPKKNKHINSKNKNYNNISIYSNGKKTINNFRKKTPHRIVRQRKEISPNLKMSHYCYSNSNSYTKLQSKDNLKNNKNNSNYIRIMKKSNLSNNNTSKIASNNISNFNSNNLTKNHIKIQNLLNNLGNNDYNHFKKLNHNIYGIINNGLIIGNIKSKTGVNTINSSVSNHSTLRKFKYNVSNNSVKPAY